MRNVVIRTAVVAAILLAGMACTIGRASAMSEICPARVADWHALATDKAGVTYGVVLSAMTARAVRGQVVAQTNAGYFTFAFPDTAFALDRVTYQALVGKFEHDLYVTAPIYVRFPASVTGVKAWWVTHAQTTGEKVIGWDVYGPVACPLSPTDASSFPGLRPSKIARLSALPYDLSIVPAASVPVIVAATTAAPGDTNCAKPFANAVVRDAQVPSYPRSMMQEGSSGGTTLVEVVLGADGRPVDLPLYQSSGESAFDKSAEVAAMQTKYTPAISFCRPVPSVYLFRADFSAS